MKRISLEDFVDRVNHILGIRIHSNKGQYQAIVAPNDESLFIVAGPGSGKTTVITLRVLKLIFVDGVKPEEIIVTTFTRKAAAELLSRIVDWGERLSAEFDIRELGFNLVKAGTIDSIISELMRDYRAPGEHPPQTIDEFVSKGIMLRKALIGGENEDRRGKIESYYKELNQSNRTNMNELCNFLNLFKDKTLYDMVDIERFMQNNRIAEKAIEAIEIYINELKEKKLFDFSLLASYFLNKLKEGAMADFLKNIKFLLIDEYQDTNYLQEQIYFEIAKSAVANGGSITVVGDDDQSLYRFRGATVELFIDFPKRIEAQIGVKPKTVYLSYNYRSTINIVKFLNKFVSLDEKYKQIRAGNKPIMYPAPSREFYNYPILGMFRDRLDKLAEDLAEFIHQVLNDGYRFEWRSMEYLIEAESVSDIVLLCPSPKEEIYNRRRLPKLLRENLEKKGIKVFNPRGRNIEKVEVVQLMCGLILECIDPDAQIQSSMKLKLGDQISSLLNSWREEAKRFVKNHSSQELKDFWNAWRRRSPLNSNVKPDKTYKVSILELTYSLV
ncbi:MAG: ATP-dependent helicase, partial [Aquificaceae bacterium]|nr:ATP-dependent helicase [Aquificaceae bacterium]